MLTRLNPTTIAPPFSRYAHGMLVEGRNRWLHVSGQVGVDAKGNLAADAAGQMAQAWRNVLAVLAEAGMTLDDLVKVTVFITRPIDVALYRETRDGVLEGREIASTLLIVAGLAAPNMLCEIEAVAAS